MQSSWGQGRVLSEGNPTTDGQLDLMMVLTRNHKYANVRRGQGVLLRIELRALVSNVFGQKIGHGDLRRYGRLHRTLGE